MKYIKGATQFRNILVFVSAMALFCSCSELLFGYSVKLPHIRFNYKNSWSSWSNVYSTCSVYNDGSGCALKTDGGMKYFEFKITDYVAPSKKEIKKHRKSEEGFEYHGTVSYYVNDTYPTAEASAKACNLVKPNPRKDTTPQVKRTANAKIIIAPYKKHPEVYYVQFDNIVVGIDIGDLDIDWD